GNTVTAPLRRWLTPVVAVLASLAVLAGPTPATAAPTAAAPGNPSGHEEDGEPPLITEAIDAANRAFLQAKAKLAKSQDRQRRLAAEVKTAQAELEALSPQVNQ